MVRHRKQYPDTDDSEAGDLVGLDQCLSLAVPSSPRPQMGQRDKYNTGLGDNSTMSKNYMVLSTTPTSTALTTGNDEMNRCESNYEVVRQGDKTMSFTSLLNSIRDPETFLQQGSAYLLQFVSNSHRLIWILGVTLAAFFFYPLTSTIMLGTLLLLLIGGHQSEDSRSSCRTAKWTVTCFSEQLKDGFLASPPFLDRCGQWRMVVKQKKGMDGVQTMFGLMCTDVFPQIELVTANVTFFCTNQYGQELSGGGGMRNLRFQHEYQCAGDSGFSRPIRLSRRQTGDEDVVTIQCSVEFHKKTRTFLRTLVRNLREGDSQETRSVYQKKGKNVVTEHGQVFPGDLEFQEEHLLQSAFRNMARFVHHSETKTFIWEIPGFASLLENSELWGIYSPQFFLNSHDICSIWRMKLLEVQGVFRLHVQLRGLPSSVRQVKLWYLLQLVDGYGDSVIPEHAVSRIKYPDHMNLWGTTRHILYRRETILERFLGVNGSLTLRISLQMEPNDVGLMEVDSDEWIQGGSAGGLVEDHQEVSPSSMRMLQDTSHQMRSRPMITN